MARHIFGGSPADYAMERVGNQLLVRPGAVGTVWDALTGGTQYTDLTDLAGAPITQVVADADGGVTFMGPDGVTSLYVDFGYTRRFALTAVDIGSVLGDFIAQGGTPGGWAQLDETGHIDSTQIPAQLDWIVVHTHGAKGDGVTDDTIAIQNAINACPPGGVVYFPRGVYRTSATLDWKNGVTLKGSHANMMVGPGMTDADYPCYIQPTMPFTGGSVLQIVGEDDGQHPAISGEQRMINLMLDGSQLTGSSIDGIFGKGNVQNVVLDNVCIRQMPNNGIICGTNAADEMPYSWRLHHVMIDNCHSNGMVWEKHTDLTLNDVQVIGCWAQGIVLTNCANAQLTQCRTEWNGSNGYRITGNWGDWSGSGGMQMTGCSTDRNGQYGVLIDATGNGPVTLSGLMLRRDGRNGGPGGGGYAGLAVTANAMPVVVAGVTCFPGTDDAGTSGTSPDYGVKIDGATDVQLDQAYLHAAVQGLYQTGTNTRIYIGTNVTTVAGLTTETARAKLTARLGQLNAESLTIDSPARAAFLKTTSTTEHTLTVYQAGTTGASGVALNVISDKSTDSAMYLTGHEAARGTLKVTHKNPGPNVNSDASAAALSVDLQRNGLDGTAAQGLVILATDGPTTGNLILARNNGRDDFVVKGSGRAGVGMDIGEVPEASLEVKQPDTTTPGLVVTAIAATTSPILQTKTSAGTATFEVGSSGAIVHRAVSFYTNSLQLGTTSTDLGGSVGAVISMKNVTTPPSTNPTGGGILYTEGGAIKYRGSAGTVTTIAPA